MYRELIDAYIDSKKEEMLQDMMELVKIDSQKGEAEPGKPFGEGPAEVLAKAEEIMASYGLKTRNYDNYVVTGDFGPEEKKLDILAHLDVVPVTDEWTVTQPFDPLIVDGKIYGRGTVDDKGPAIAALYAIRAVKDLGIPMKKSVRLILGADEECGSSDLKYYYSIEKEAPCTFTPDGEFPVINLEKGRLSKQFAAHFQAEAGIPKVISLKSGDKSNVVPGKGRVVFAGLEEQVLKQACEKAAEMTGVSFQIEKEGQELSITAKGAAAHGSTPEMGNNALTAILYLISILPLAASEGHNKLLCLGQMFPHKDYCGEALKVNMSDEISGALTMSLNVLDYTEEHLVGEFDCRAPLCANDENLTAVVKKAFSEAGINMEAGNMIEAHHVPADSPFVTTLLDSYKRYTGIEGKPLAIGGGTYVHDLERGVAFGCTTGDVDNHMHGDDEFMEIDTLIMSAKIFADVIVKLCC